MVVEIPNVFTPEEAKDILDKLSEAEFIDGKKTAGWNAKGVKNNQQLKNSDPRAAVLKDKVKSVLSKNLLFQSTVRPKSIHTLLFSRYEVGMAYGRHTDNAMMGGTWRSDVSFTIFLTPPETYTGGELIIEGPSREQSYRLAAGCAIAYPSSTLHRVAPIIEGSRWAIVGWVQSWVRDPAKREILFDLDTARRSIFNSQGKTNDFDLISKSMTNLLRSWMD
ncbi:MAG: Fe2+-dependent dioxygenase [Leptolyngbya sp. SIO4C1]|nr:Fe2+-dependent dioxygenase [Leptolyngbya sp. SIO4C1]